MSESRNIVVRSFRTLVIVFLSVSSLVPLSARAWTIASHNAVAIDTSAVPGAMELSGLAYRAALGGATHELFAVQDSGNQLVTLSLTLAADGALSSAMATASQTLAPGFDFEGVAIGPLESVLVAEETTPAIRRYNAATGASTDLLAMPPVFGSDRPNFAFESLTRAADGQTYWAANEEALTPDGALSNTSHGTTVRLQQFTYDSAGELALGPQFAYEVDAIHVGSATDARTRSGLVDLVALPDGSLLALERSLGITGVVFGVTLYEYESRIYRVTFEDATDTSQAPFDSGLIGQAYTALTKTLLWSGQAGGGFGQNLEGLALGPLLPGGEWSLLGVVDNGGGADLLSGNNVVSFSLAPPLPGDFNFDGLVDAADYVTWRKGLGAGYLADHYDVWRSNFGRSTSGSGAQQLAAPEPASWRLAVAVAAITIGFAGRGGFVTLRENPCSECTFLKRSTSNRS